MTVRLEPKPTDSLARWIEEDHQRYIASRIQSGESRETAVRKAEQSRDENFPGGRPLDTHLIFDVWADDTVVGHLWLGPYPAGTSEW